MITEQIHFIETWKAMEKLVTTGKTRAIGVSNFSRIEMEEILGKGSVVSRVCIVPEIPRLDC